jgi:hypothetical protein
MPNGKSSSVPLLEVSTADSMGENLPRLKRNVECGYRICHQRASKLITVRPPNGTHI